MQEFDETAFAEFVIPWWARRRSQNELDAWATRRRRASTDSAPIFFNMLWITQVAGP
jgi:hypothetical protein